MHTQNYILGMVGVFTFATTVVFINHRKKIAFMNPTLWSSKNTTKYDMRYVLRKYKNGMRVLYICITPPSELVYIRFITKVGMAMESEAKHAEASHFLEHLLATFTSTKHPSAHENNRSIEQRGGQSNASTSVYSTDYYIVGNSTDFPFYMDLIGNAFIDFKTDSSIFQQEKNAVVEELRMYQTEIWTPFAEATSSLLYPNHPISRTYAECIENTHNFTPSSIQEYYHDSYGTNNTLLIIASSLSVSEMEKEAFPFLNQEKIVTVPKPVPYRVVALKKPYSFFYKTESATAYSVVFMYNHNIGSFHKDRHALYLICNILTNGFESILMKRARTEEGLVYGFNCKVSMDEYTDKDSDFRIQTTCKKENVQKVINIVLDSVQSLCKTISKDDMSRIRNGLNIQFMRANRNQSLHKFSKQYGHYALYEKPIQKLYNVYQKQLAVSKEDLCKMSKIVFTPSNLIVAVSGNSDISISL